MVQDQSVQNSMLCFPYKTNKARSIMKLSNGAKQRGARENQTQHKLFSMKVYRIAWRL